MKGYVLDSPLFWAKELPVEHSNSQKSVITKSNWITYITIKNSYMSSEVFTQGSYILYSA